MKYDIEFDEGGEAYLDAEPRTWNPYAYQTPAWYAWDAGWARAERDGAIIDLEALV